MTAPQLEYYADDRAGQTAIVSTSSGAVVAWVLREGGRLRARRGTWVSDPVDTIPEVILLVSRAARE